MESDTHHPDELGRKSGLARRVFEVFRRDTLLRRLSLLYAVTIVAVVLAGAAVISFEIWPHYQSLEQRESEHRLHAVLQAVQSEQDRLRELVNTNAVWDDAFQFAIDGNAAFAATNYSPEALQQIGVDAVLVTRNDGSTLFSGGQGNFAALAHAVENAIAAAPALHLDATQDARQALLLLNQGVVLVEERRIVRSDGSGPSQGVLVFARRVGPQVHERMHQLTGTAFVLGPAAGEPAKPNQERRIQTVVRDAYNRPTIEVAVLGNHEVLAVGKTTMVVLIVTASLMLLLVAAAFAAALLLAVIAPVAALREAVAAASKTQEPFAVPERAPAEIKALAYAFDRSLWNAKQRSEQRNLAIAEKQLAEKANLAKSQFIANISHELRTPLNAIIGYSEMIAESAAEDGRSGDVEDAKRVTRAGRALLDLINDVLDFSKLEAGKMELSLSEFDIAPLLHSVVEIATPLARSKSLTLNVVAAGDLGAMVSDAQKLRQCLINLCSNAIKFTERGGVTIEIRRFVRNGTETLRFSVSDTGIGIEAGALQRIFHPFSQADASITRRFGGTGLGLAITRDMVRLMHGRIGVKSTEGVGTQFVIEVPAAIQTAIPAAA